MNVPVGATVNVPLTVRNIATQAVADAVTGTILGVTYPDPVIEVRQGKALVTLAPAATKFEKYATGQYNCPLVLDPATFKPGRDYAIFAKYMAPSGAVIANSVPRVDLVVFLRVMAAETNPGVPQVMVGCYAPDEKPVKEADVDRMIEKARTAGLTLDNGDGIPQVKVIVETGESINTVEVPVRNMSVQTTAKTDK